MGTRLARTTARGEGMKAIAWLLLVFLVLRFSFLLDTAVALPRALRPAAFLTPATASAGLVQIEVRNPTAAGSGSGSGVVLPQGILTNYHVAEAVGPNPRLFGIFRLADGAPAILRLQVVALSASDDLALLRPEDPSRPIPAPAVSLGKTPLYLGEPVTIEGYPWGNPWPVVSSGVVVPAPGNTSFEGLMAVSHLPTGLRATVEARIRPGDSGGPVLDQAGHLVGLNEAVTMEDGHYTRYGVIIPRSAIAAFLAKASRQGP